MLQMALGAAFMIGASHYDDLHCLNALLETNVCESADYLVWNSEGAKRFAQAECQADSFTSLHVFETDAGVHWFWNEISEDGKVEERDEVRAECPSTVAELPKSEFRFLTPPTRNFHSRESFALVASDSICKTLSAPLSELLKQYQSEGRSSVQLICVPGKTASSGDPSLVRKYIISKMNASVEGLILVGGDLPPFEYFLRLSSGNFDYGNSDLPYGDLSESFWSKPLKKTKSGIKNRVYFEKDHVYLLNFPTSLTFDLSSYPQKSLNAPSGRRLWVSRWVGTSNLLGDFQSFVARRKTYLPSASHNFLYLRGGAGLMFYPPGSGIQGRVEDDLRPFLSHLPVGSQSLVLTNAYFLGSLRKLNSQVTFLSLDDHGSPVSLGDLQAYDLRTFDLLPPIVNADACLTGNWFDSDEPSSWTRQIFHRSMPPLGVISSRGVKWLRTIGTPDSGTKEVLLNNWRVGQSLGNRQIETFLLNHQGSSHIDKRELLVQLLHSLSLFGDGSIEF